MDTSNTNVNKESVSLNTSWEGKLTPDDLRFTPPTFAEEVLRPFLKQRYGVTGDFTRLAGERDQNFRIQTTGGAAYVLKISSPDEMPLLVDLQIRVLEHIEKVNPLLPVPRHLRSRDGAYSATLHDSDGRAHSVRLLSYLPGTPLGDLGEVSLATIRNLGILQGNLCLALRGFSHPAAAHFMPWDSMNGLVTAPCLRIEYLPPELVGRAQAVLEHLEQVAMPALHGLDAQVIHNDAHGGNVLLDPDNPEQIVGLIDFGDVVHRPVVIDLSISLASMVERYPDYLGAARALVGGFDEQMKIPEAQRELLYDAVLARQILTVQLLTFRRAHTQCAPELGEVDLPNSIRGLLATLNIDRNEFLDAIFGDS